LLQGLQTKFPQARQLCLSQAACTSVLDVLTQVKRLAQQALWTYMNKVETAAEE
jgi:hypothetical protein